MFNLTPALLLQLEDLAARGAKDRYWVATEIPAARLTADDRRFLLERFFDVNPKVIARFPRYRELADDRAGRGIGEALDAWSEQAFRDLQGSGTAVGLTLAGRVLGFRATHVARSDGAGGACLAALDMPETCEPLPAARSEQGVELQIPFALLGAMESGALVRMVAELPRAGTELGGGAVRALQVPDISAMTVLIDVDDPAGDDHGPGAYTYPLDEVFVPGSYDLTRFQVGTDEEHLIFGFGVRTPIANPWGSPRGLSVQTFDVHVDTGPDGERGARLLLPGRNAALPAGHGWEYALTVEGWDSAFYVADAAGVPEERQPSFDLVVFPAKGRVVVRLPRELFPEGDPAEWGTPPQ